jgi:hypothetical protein
MDIRRVLIQILEKGQGKLYINPAREIYVKYADGTLTMDEVHQFKIAKFELPEGAWTRSRLLLEQLFETISAAVNIRWDDCTNYHKYFCGQRLSLIEVLTEFVSYATLSKLGNIVYTPSTDLLEELYDNCELKEEDEIYQAFIIDKQFYDILNKYTTEYICFSGITETYLWGVTHYGTNWEYVFTEIEI